MTDAPKPKSARKRAALRPPVQPTLEPSSEIALAVPSPTFDEPAALPLATATDALRGAGRKVLDVLEAGGLPQSLWPEALAAILFSLVDMHWPMPAEGLRRATPLDSLLLSMNTLHRVARELRQDAITVDFAMLCEEMAKALRAPRVADRPLTQEDPAGTPVNVTLDDSSTWRTVTRSAVWQLGDGTFVVLLGGMTGGYRVDRCQVPT